MPFGTGFDWWLGTQEGDLFQKKARLEVSGLLREAQMWRVTARISEKKKQTEVSDQTTKTPAVIVVVEFSAPLSKVVKR